ncbi:MAG: 50S ribosomal protein L9 [Clostridiales Family XIII bacterium]|jgi:large subunit ribosomal protein L9|nr:50S ribosomal protein L9 [Clostridiales Family XIII bacterium]
MKLILLEDVVGAGKAGDVVEVATGYARNKLLPSGLALEASKANMNTLEHRRAKIAAKKAADRETAQALADQLSGREVSFVAKAGEAGKLFGSVTAQDIAAAVAEKHGFEIDKRKLDLDSPIKEIGTHEVSIKIYPEVAAVIKVIVEAEGGAPEAVPAPEPAAAEERAEPEDFSPAARDDSEDAAADRDDVDEDVEEDVEDADTDAEDILDGTEADDSESEEV